MKAYSVTEYAKKLGVSRQAVLQQIDGRRLDPQFVAQKIGKTWVIIKAT